MQFSPEELEDLEAAIEEIRSLDPADVPEPAARLADMLSRLLDETEES
jgi:hypothetical protein